MSTQLTSVGDAQVVAAADLGRLHLQSWRVGGLSWLTGAADAMTADQVDRTLDLLDGTRRLAAPILLTNLPAWSPVGRGDAAADPAGRHLHLRPTAPGRWT